MKNRNETRRRTYTRKPTPSPPLDCYNVYDTHGTQVEFHNVMLQMLSDGTLFVVGERDGAPYIRTIFAPGAWTIVAAIDEPHTPVEDEVPPAERDDPKEVGGIPVE